MAEREDIMVIRKRSWIQFLLIISTLILLSYLMSFLRVRVDLTEDRRYTLSQVTNNILRNVKNDIYIQVYLDGEMPVPLKRLKRSVREMLDEFRIASSRKIDYEFINPAGIRDAAQREAHFKALYDKGLNPVNIMADDTEGGSTRKVVFPGMIVNYNGIEVPVNFLKNNSSLSYEQNILSSIESLEYEMIQTISTLSSDTVYKVAFIEGHGEIPEIEVADITFNLARFFTIDRGVPGGRPGILDDYAAIIIAGPEKEFSEADKFVIDQYIMNGGRVLWLFEEVDVNADSLVYGRTAALYRPLNIEDQLFRYGARVNPSVIQDLECMIIRLTVMTEGVRQQVVQVPWIYYPLLIPSPAHPVTRHLNRVKGEFTNYIDTVGLDGRIRKSILLYTSAFTRIVQPPFMISLKEAEQVPDEREFNRSNLPVAVLLEGVFPSAFRNRMTTHLHSEKNLDVKNESVPTRMIVAADGDIIRNEVRRAGNTETPLPLGQDKYTGEVFGNRDFIINCMNYLVDDNGLMDLRSRELRLRLLDGARIRKERKKWQLINLAGPVLLVILSGALYGYLRRRLYTKR
ncbi:MAG: gliding motility-associated ABC transporter substrate-binding protein GldG [Bacteroidales bacterium]|nr:gliding motility-associated ABC transporter substrate-binding protein GldG [Bacteroidales bacterium]